MTRSPHTPLFHPMLAPVAPTPVVPTGRRNPFTALLVPVREVAAPDARHAAAIARLDRAMAGGAAGRVSAPVDPQALRRSA